MENVRNRVEVEFNRRDGKEKIVNQQSKLTFNVVHKAYAKYGSYIFKQKEVLMDKPNYLGFAVLQLRKFLMYETYYGKLQP